MTARVSEPSKFNDITNWNCFNRNLRVPQLLTIHLIQYFIFFLLYIKSLAFPADACRRNDVMLTSMWRQHVTSTLGNTTSFQRCVPAGIASVHELHLITRQTTYVILRNYENDLDASFRILKVGMQAKSFIFRYKGHYFTKNADSWNSMAIANTLSKYITI